MTTALDPRIVALASALALIGATASGFGLALWLVALDGPVWSWLTEQLVLQATFWASAGVLALGTAAGSMAGATMGHAQATKELQALELV